MSGRSMCAQVVPAICVSAILAYLVRYGMSKLLRIDIESVGRWG